MTNFKLKKGYDLNIRGGITDTNISVINSSQVAIVPDDFTGITPRLDIKDGETVLAGDSLFHDKDYPEIKITSPVSGKVSSIVRGERRKILSIIIDGDDDTKCKKFDAASGSKALLLDSGLWGYLRQRPYDVVPNPNVRPRDIFITAFDSAPLAPDLSYIVGNKSEFLQKGIDALAELTDGDVYLSCRPEKTFSVKNCIVNTFEGPHPSGNAGVQIANIKPVNKGEVVWAVDIVTVVRFGELIATGELSFDTVVAVTGESVKKPQYIKCTIGCNLQSLLKDNLNSTDNIRIISGNVLTGKKCSTDGYLRYPYRHITVIPEIKNDAEFMGWASLSPKKFSLYHSFTRWLFPHNKPESFDAKTNGGERAIIMSGEYDRMLPMDIYAEFLIKAIIAFDIDKMEQLGIYEVAPEDFALCEFADTSKLELQRIVREGLDKLNKEMN